MYFTKQIEMKTIMLYTKEQVKYIPFRYITSSLVYIFRHDFDTYYTCMQNAAE